MALVFHNRNLLIIDCSLHTDEEIHSQGLQEEVDAFLAILRRTRQGPYYLYEI